MHAANIPSIASGAHTHTFYTGGDLLSGTTSAGSVNAFVNSAGGASSILRNLGIQATSPIQEPHMPARRLVQVIIMDPNENVPLSDCLLFKGEEKLTDATDQELFFELDIKEMLEAHNAKRVKFVDKKVKDRTEYLEPVKIRELKMVVVNIATF